MRVSSKIFHSKDANHIASILDLKIEIECFVQNLVSFGFVKRYPAVELRLVIERLLVQCSNRAFRHCVRGKDNANFPLGPSSPPVEVALSDLRLANRTAEKGVLGWRGRHVQNAWFTQRMKYATFVRAIIERNVIVLTFQVADVGLISTKEEIDFLTHRSPGYLERMTFWTAKELAKLAVR